MRQVVTKKATSARQLARLLLNIGYSFPVRELGIRTCLAPRATVPALLARPHPDGSLWAHQLRQQLCGDSLCEFRPIERRECQPASLHLGGHLKSGHESTPQNRPSRRHAATGYRGVVTEGSVAISIPNMLAKLASLPAPDAIEPRDDVSPDERGDC